MNKTLYFKVTSSHNWSSLRDDQYTLQKLNKMQTRRMTSLAKVTVDLALMASKGVELDYVVLASRHGEVGLAFDLIQSILKKEIPSPTKFSQSTHNAMAGLFSIESKCRAPMTAISAGRNSLVMGLFNCANHLSINPGHKVLFIFGDARLPHVYNSEDADINTDDISLAMIIESGKEFSLKQFQTDDAHVSFNQALTLLDHLRDKSQGVELCGKDFKLETIRCDS